MKLQSCWQKVYLTDKLKRQLAQISYAPLTVVEAPAGFGKTTAVREYLKEATADGARQYWYTCLSERPSVAWMGICDLLSNVDGEMANSLKKLGFPTHESLVYIQSCFKNLQCARETYLVIDNYQLIQSDVSKELVNVFSMHGCPRLHMIFITQHLGRSFKFHNSNIYTIESSAFFFDRESTANLFKMEGIRLNDEELNSVYQSTEGWISALRLQISHYRQTGCFEHTADIDKLVETAIWNRLTPKQKNCLVSLSVIGSFTARQAAIMLGEDALPEYVKDLLSHSDFIRYFPREKIYVMHSILQNYLRSQFHQFHSETFQMRVLHTAGLCCVAEADYFAAAQYFHQVKDYDAIFSMPLNLIYLANKRDNNIVEFLLEIINASPEDIMGRYPFVMLMFAYLMRMEGEYECYRKLDRLIDRAIRHNLAGLLPEEPRQLKGEYLLLNSLNSYNNLKKIREGQLAAVELLGGASRFGLNEIPVTLGSTSVLSMFWREPGKMDDALKELQDALPNHLKLTQKQGIGADSAYQAEMMLMRGDDVQAEILCHKALYQARSRQEIYICLCVEQILARIAILRGDVEGFNTALENIKGYAQENSNLYVLRMVDICLSTISIALGTTDMVAKWLYDFESISKKVYARAVPYVSILYSHLLVSNKRYAELLGLVDNTIQSAKDMNYILPQVYSLIFKARACYETGHQQEAFACLSGAFELALPDQAYMPFAQFDYLGDLLIKVQNCAERNPKTVAIVNYARQAAVVPEMFAERRQDIDAIIALYQRYHKGRKNILQALGQEKSPLTPREREVAILAKARLSHKEIAEKLCISTATVRTILYNAYGKLGIHSKSELTHIDF